MGLLPRSEELAYRPKTRLREVYPSREDPVVFKFLSLLPGRLRNPSQSRFNLTGLWFPRGTRVLRHPGFCGKQPVARYIQLDIIRPCGQCVSSGKGVEEIRVADDSGAYRVIYVARRADAVYVLHAFQKKTQATSRRDIDTARRRFAQLSRGGK
jgi:putative component of toxin-antitoxin plasmid stabilization module